jgi:Na+-driven multidrug efflux pump
MVSNLIGQGEDGKIGMLLRRAVALNFANTGPFLILAMVFPALAISLVGTEGAAMSDCVSSLRVLVLVLCAAIPGQIYSYAVCGTGDSLGSLGIEVVTSTCLVLAAYAAAVLLNLPPAYTWLALGISWIVCLALSAIWLRCGHWQRVKI